MSTRIALFCDKLLEAGWLAALIIAPLFFNVYSSRVFEPDKISLVRSIALVMVAAWLIKSIEAGRPRESLGDALRALVRENPLFVPTLVILISYLISTLFSVAPLVSLGGSYQRLQGTYTTFSYIAIFMIAAGSLRTRAQLDRLVNTVIVVSFPVAFFGILQHFQLDPLPWGGDTTTRVAANMGNSIFVAAYLILIVPVTLARWIETLAHATATMAARRRALAIAVAVALMVALAAVWALDFALGVGAILALYVLSSLLVLFTRVRLSDAWLAVTYAVVLVAQLLTIVFSQSRGPELGLGVGLFAFLVLMVLSVMHYVPRVWRTIALTGIVGSAIVAIAFLLIFNLPASPLESLRSVPYIGRLGQILDRNSPTAQVRELIWEGAVKLILPHAPLWSPTTGDDPFNAIRPLVGYGPEAMYVAYNPFYPPDLGHLEQRNASPDRSHNETFDSLVMTGLLGFVAYILLFMTVFYFGLKSLGVITTTAQRDLFVGLWLGGGLTSAAVFGLLNGWSWVGVALPFGMMAGLVLFLLIDAIRRYRREEQAHDLRRALWISALIAALIAHFAEIHFGIAIVSTRTYFWVYAAVLVILGTNRLTLSPQTAAAFPNAMPERAPAPGAASASARPLAALSRAGAVVDGEPSSAASRPAQVKGTPAAPRATEAKRRKRRRPVETARPGARKEGDGTAIPLGPVLVWTAITTIIMVTLAFEFLNNQTGLPSAMEAVGRSLFFKGDSQSFGVFLMLVLTCFIAGVIGFVPEAGDRAPARSGLGTAVLLFVVLMLTVVVWYALFQMRWLTQSGDLTDAFINILSVYYVTVFLLIGAAAVALAWGGLPVGAVFMRGPANAVVAPVLSVALVVLVYLTNYTGVSADILYKSGNNTDLTGAYDRSIVVYQRALVLQPAQDFYSLFLGRAYLEAGRQATDPTLRAKLLDQAEQTLLSAQRLNPLNTDHSANLARLYRIWATMVSDPAQSAAYYDKSSQYYAVATRLSPNTAYLYNEWSQTYFQSGDLENTHAKLEQSLKLDTQFAQTYLYLGEYYRVSHDNVHAADYYFKALALDPAALAEADGSPAAAPMTVLAQPEYITRAVQAFQAAAEANPSSVAPHYALADLYKQSGQSDQARQELEAVVKAAPSDYMARLAVVNFYSEAGQIDAAVGAMRAVMDLIPTRNPDFQRFQDFYAQLQNLQKLIQNAQKSPTDVTAHRSLAAMWKARGQPQFALPEYETVARLAANDYDANKNLVLLNLQLNHTNEAQRALTAAIALSPDSDKPIWQNVQMALNSQKAQQMDQALKQAQAALALAGDADKPALQSYVTWLQGQTK